MYRRRDVHRKCGLFVGNGSGEPSCSRPKYTAILLDVLDHLNMEVVMPRIKIYQ